MSKKITRSTVNEQQYSAPEFPKSGFPLSYRRYSSYALGRIHVAGFHWTMPGDKISGSTRGKCTFHRIVTPIVSPVNAMQYNVYLPLRPLDRTFKKGMTPTKLNAMSANWSMPTVTTRYLVDQLLRALYNFDYNATIDDVDYTDKLGMFTYIVNNAGDADATLKSIYDTLVEDEVLGTGVTFDEWLYDSSNLGSGNIGMISAIVHNLTADGTLLTQMADDLYLRDALIDIANSITAKLGDADHPISQSMTVQDFLNLFLSTVLTPFIGRYSYYGELKYEFLRPFDFYRIAHGLRNVDAAANYNGFLKSFSDTPQNEYSLRAMYAVWYELFRNVDLEPVSSNLPDWQEWGSTSIFNMSAGGNLLYLIYRIRSWEKDMFISAQIDDLSRHVYAPILANHNYSAAIHDDNSNNLDVNTTTSSLLSQHSPFVYQLAYQNQLDDTRTTISCPVPSNINDILSSLDSTFVDIYGLELNTLRQSQMLERYLKRNYLFGDEYQDRMLAHYNSRVSDMRINKPEVLSQGMDGYEMGQQVSNVSTDETKVGDRTATAEIEVNGETFTTFCEEFGIVLSLVCFMPRAMYDGSCPQNYLGKQIDMPLPEFATNNEEFGRKLEIAGSGLYQGYDTDAMDNRFMFGRYPAYHAWRSRVDEVGGEFLDELQDATFRRFFGMFSDDTTPKLNYFFIHCRPNLNMFANNVLYDMQLYGDLVNECFVERVLPTPVETI